ncbi:MAG TPA: hypothetical protein VGM78_11965 [Ilumatobacteraceae bacterium]
MEVLAVTIAVIPVVAAIVRAIVEHWIPIGDDALDEIRSADVFSAAHFPLLGTWSSASIQAGKDLNHPGPLLFDLLAIPVRLFGGPTGVALGCGLINAAAVIGIALVGYRLRGRAGLLCASMVAAALAWTLGSRMLIDPWNPHVIILPCLLMLMLAWAVASGAARLLPWLLLVGSLCLETHVSYAYLVPALCLAAIIGCALVYRRRWKTDPGCRAADWPRLRRGTITAIVVFVLCWAQPLWEELTSSGQGNLTRLATSAGGQGPAIGARLGVRLLAAVVALPPWWSRSSFIGAVPYTRYNADGTTITPHGVPGLGASALALLALAAVLAFLAWKAWRRAARADFTALVITSLALVVALATLVTMPIGILGLTPHQMRWMWSIGAFTVFVVLINATAITTAAQRVEARHRRLATGAAVAVVAVFSAINLPAYVQLAGPSTDTTGQAVALSLSRQLDKSLPVPSVYFDLKGLRFLDNDSAVVMAALQRHDVDFYVDDPGMIRQLGEDRRFTGQTSTRIYLLVDHDSLVTPAGATRLAFTSPLSTEQIGTLLDDESALVDTISTDGLTLTPAGQAAVAAGRYGATNGDIADAAAHAAELVGNGTVASLVADGGLVLSPDDTALFQEASALRLQITPTTVGVYIQPITAG